MVYRSCSLKDGVYVLTCAVCCLCFVICERRGGSTSLDPDVNDVIGGLKGAAVPKCAVCGDKCSTPPALW